GNTVHLQILMQHGHYADWEVPGNTSPNLEKADTLVSRILYVPVSQKHHVFNTAFHLRRMKTLLNAVPRKKVGRRGVLPPGDNDRQFLFIGGIKPGILQIDLILLDQIQFEDTVQVFMRES